MVAGIAAVFLGVSVPGSLALLGQFRETPQQFINDPNQPANARQIIKRYLARTPTRPISSAKADRRTSSHSHPDPRRRLRSLRPHVHQRVARPRSHQLQDRWSRLARLRWARAELPARLGAAGQWVDGRATRRDTGLRGRSRGSPRRLGRCPLPLRRNPPGCPRKPLLPSLGATSADRARQRARGNTLGPHHRAKRQRKDRWTAACQRRRPHPAPRRTIPPRRKLRMKLG